MIGGLLYKLFFEEESNEKALEWKIQRLVDKRFKELRKESQNGSEGKKTT